MKAVDEVGAHLRARPADLWKAREGGQKIVGYTPGGFMPEELVLAAGAIPVCLARGGDHYPVGLAGAYVCRWLDTFCRAQIGYALSKDDPYYGLLDLMVVPITDNHIRAISDIVDYNTDIEVFPFGVPHMKEEATYYYYLHGLTKLKAKLEEVTGNEITEARLKEAISLCNRERELLRAISLTRMQQPSPMRSRDFVVLNHATLVADKDVMSNILESAYEEMKADSAMSQQGPRLLLTGSTLAIGDYRILDIIEEAGGNVVAEEFGEGLRPYRESVDLEGDPLIALTDCYFARRVPPAWFRPASETRDHLLSLVRDYDVSGVVWYQLMYRESYKVESYLFREILRKETGLPMLEVESDYAPAETGQLRTRMETFIQAMAGG